MIDPEFLEKLDRFDATLNSDASDVRKGEHESRNLGEGLTFSDYRRYSPGDDTRLVDWKLYARTEEYFVKQFEEERNLTIHVLLDASESMDFGDGSRNKFEYGAKLGLGFAYLAAQEHNDFQFSTFDERVERLDGGRSSAGDLLALIESVNETDPSGQTNFREALESYESRIDSRSVVLVVSDFLADPEEIWAGTAALARNDLVLARVLAPGERDPESTGDTLFEDVETGVARRTYFGGSKSRQYRESLESHVSELEAQCDDLQARHELVGTGEDFFDAFASVWIE